MRVDFYILNTTDKQAELHFACRLAEKALSQDTTVYIHTHSEQDAEQLDDLLWSFSETSFIPHAIVGHPLVDDDVKVLIGFGEQRSPAGLLIKLAPLEHENNQYPRIAEIVSQDKNSLQASRKAYRHYQQAGFSVHHHNSPTKKNNNRPNLKLIKTDNHFKDNIEIKDHG
ncbi:DNA polymerase III subunit chi [Piscirickettsia litoralis]|uniref:DNA polymerase III subunit chi n=1 Tax=Piscirickettsia litoralis TaxID=1891921 RepID=UPI000981B8D1|nr:DNA polymerase III subunit chi [Piscirickettsia litoralis]